MALAVVFSLLVSDLARADQTGTKPPSVAALCEAVRQHAAKSPESARVFSIVADRDDPDAMEGAWQEFPNIDSRNRLAETKPVYAAATVWLAQSGFRFVSTYNTSPSGDWIHDVFYCFRANGSLAWMESDLRTFFGNVRRIRTRRFDPSGKTTSSVLRTYDLESGKALDDPAFMDQDEPIYLRARSLPFGQLLAGPSPFERKAHK